MKRRGTAILLASAMAVTSLAGCAGGSTDTGSTAKNQEGTAAAEGQETSADAGSTADYFRICQS